MTWSIVCANKVVTTVAKNVKYDRKKLHQVCASQLKPIV